jgi:hypothetical protein
LGYLVIQKECKKKDWSRVSVNGNPITSGRASRWKSKWEDDLLNYFLKYESKQLDEESE